VAIFQTILTSMSMGSFLYNKTASISFKSMSSSFPIIQFQTRLNDDEIAGLEPYLMMSERGHPIAFEGRADPQKAVKNKIQRLRSGYGPEDCNTIIVEGAPGAGKTSLLRHIKEKISSEKINQDVIPLMFGSGAVNDPVLFLQEFLKHRKVDFERLSYSYTKKGTGKVDFKLFQMGRGVSHHFPSLADRVRNSPGEVWGVIRESLKNNDDPIFLLLIDESQRIEKNSENTNTLVVDMHNVMDLGGLKIIPVFAGLSDIARCLAKVGITRPADSKFKLRLLEPEEGAHVCLSTIKKLKIDKLLNDEDLKLVCMLLDNASDGWPRHLHHYLRYFVNEVFNSHRDGRDNMDLRYVLDLGHDNRIRYYQDRMNLVEFDLGGTVLNRIARESEADSTMSLEELTEAFEGVIDDVQEVKALINSYVHIGILDENLDGTYEFPIPSLQTFLANDRDVAATTKIMQRVRVRLSGQSLCKVKWRRCR